MAGDQLSEIRAAAYDRADISVSDPKVPAVTMDRFINAALRQASTTWEPFWLQTSATLSTVAGTSEYLLSALPSFHKLSRVEDTVMEYNLEFRNPHELLQWSRYSNQRPRIYVVEEQTLKLGPTPDAVYALNVVYYRLEDALTDEGDTPLLPMQYTDWLVCVAGRRAAIKKRDKDMAAMLQQEIARWELVIRDDIRQVKAMPRIRLREDS